MRRAGSQLFMKDSPNDDLARGIWSKNVLLFL
jgi:hypothetical protein